MVAARIHMCWMLNMKCLVSLVPVFVLQVELWRLLPNTPVARTAHQQPMSSGLTGQTAISEIQCFGSLCPDVCSLQKLCFIIMWCVLFVAEDFTSSAGGSRPGVPDSRLSAGGSRSGAPGSRPSAGGSRSSTEPVQHSFIQPVKDSPLLSLRQVIEAHAIFDKSTSNTFVHQTALHCSNTSSLYTRQPYTAEILATCTPDGPTPLK